MKCPDAESSVAYQVQLCLCWPYS